MTLWIPDTTFSWLNLEPTLLCTCYTSSLFFFQLHRSQTIPLLNCNNTLYNFFCKIKYHTLPYSWQLHIDLLQDIWTKSVECSSAFNWCPFASSATWQLHSYNNTVHFAFHCLWFVKLLCFKNPPKNCQKLLFANLWNCADLRKSSTFEPLYRWIGLLQKI